MGTANDGGGRKTQNLTPVAAREPLNYEQTLLPPDTRSSQAVAAARSCAAPMIRMHSGHTALPGPGVLRTRWVSPPRSPRNAEAAPTPPDGTRTVFELKRIVEGILKRPPDEQRLYKDDQLLDDGKTLGECGFTSQTARPQAPATVGLAFRADEAFEALRIEPFSSPPELPDVMKPQDSGSSANEQAVQ
nr:elongin-B [Vulpes vulpes]